VCTQITISEHIKQKPHFKKLDTNAEPQILEIYSWQKTAVAGNKQEYPGENKGDASV
jgi:hypothetical protein